MNKAAIFLWLVLLMILSGMLWYFTQWWFILTQLPAEEKKM